MVKISKDKQVKQEKVLRIREVFDCQYPEAGCSLEYTDPLQLMIATQLAAQCTDARVNIVTKALYEKYKDVYDFANANIAELEQDIKSTGFFRNKARNIVGACQMIIKDFGGKVPDNLDDLLKLPGVGRKTANLILNDIFGKPGIVVDTHAKRLTGRIGLTDNEDPTKIEFDLQEVVPEDYWGRFCHQLVFHGRAVCNARKPKCEKCKIALFCDFYSGKQE